MAPLTSTFSTSQRYLTLASLLGSLLLSGCWSYAVVPAKAPPESAASQRVKRWNHLFLLGLVGGQDVRLDELCEGLRVQEAHWGATPLTFALTLVTLGVYTPREVEVVCTPR